ncbi:MAG TPA: radical SAM protein [Actinocrinis sp.]|nr:radical SAM protein [Actinocrinis sp.]
MTEYTDSEYAETERTGTERTETASAGSERRKPRHGRNMQVVVKVSKLCNLRCEYCYEYPELGKPAAMSREQLAAMYRTLASCFRAKDAADRMVTRLDFIWHGGEPLMQPPRLYWDTFADQKEIFGDTIPYQNAVQTNLTLLDDDRFELLANGFTDVGVSLDVTGGLRVNRAGRDQRPKIVRNLERLLEAGQRVGCINVLSSRNIDDAERTFRFHEERGLNFRVLPLFDTGERSQTTPFEVGLQQELDALARFVDLWLASESAAQPPAPLGAYVQIAAKHLAGAEGRGYRDRREWLPLILVNTDGATYTYGESYGDPAWSIGNVFTDSFADMLAGERFERCAVEAERRVARNCLTCPFFDACGGTLVAETEMRERDHDGDGTLLCTAKPVIGYIVDQLKKRAPDLVDTWSRRAGAETDPALAAA